jgi:peptide/nickel transport system substrate-binding protein
MIREEHAMRRRSAATLVVATTGVLLLVSLVVAGSIAAASVTQHNSATIPLLRLGFGGGAQSSTLDDSKSNQASNTEPLMLEALTKVNADGSVTPWLAQSVSRPNRFTYIYHLRHGIKFWDGHVMTSADVVNSLNYARFPGSQNAAAYASVRNITAKDQYTVVVDLKRPDPLWAFNSAGPAALIFEKAFQQAHATTFGQPGTLLMGTGPWEPESFDPTSGLQLVANPHWWAGKVPIQHVTISFFANATSEALAFRAGQLDYGDTGDLTAFKAAAGGSANIVPVQSALVIYFSMNNHAGPWSDVHVRRAVAYAVNRTLLARAAGPLNTPATNYFDPSLPALGTAAQVKAMLNSVPKYPYSLAKAKKEMSESAYPHGFSYTMPQPNLLNFPTVAQALTGELSAIGIKLKVQSQTIGQWVTAISGPGAARPTTLNGWAFQPPDPSSGAVALGTPGTAPGNINNTEDYSVPAVDALIEQLQVTVNKAKRRAVFQKLAQRIAADMPIVPLYNSTATRALSTRFTFAPKIQELPGGSAGTLWVLLHVKGA